MQISFLCDYDKTASAPAPVRNLIFDACRACLIDFKTMKDERLHVHKPYFYSYTENNTLVGVFGKHKNASLNTIAILYTLPQYRKTGVAHRLVGKLKETNDNLHVTVTDGKEDSYDLTIFYQGLGFIPAPQMHTDTHGLLYLDLVWSRGGLKPACRNGQLYLI
jgi:GNAT superfamily N-acetyltransferase